MIALHEIAAAGLDGRDRIAIFGALGHDAEIEMVGEIDDRLDDHAVVPAAEHIAHEPAIDLELVRWAGV